MKTLCKQCGKTFNADRTSRKFCRKECYSNYQSKLGEPESLQKKRGVKNKKRTISLCETCGIAFEHHTARRAKYCSRECWDKRNPQVLKECKLCDREFWTHKTSGKIYCSQKCYNIDQREIKKGSNSHWWKGGVVNKNKIERGRSKYSEWRMKVFIRDDYTCQDCGKRNGNGYRVYLHAHHKEHFSKHIELRYEVSNGITLCKDCHRLRHDHKF